MWSSNSKGEEPKKESVLCSIPQIFSTFQYLLIWGENLWNHSIVAQRIHLDSMLNLKHICSRIGRILVDLKLIFLWDETLDTFPEMGLVSIRTKRLLVSRFHFGFRLLAPSLVNSSMAEPNGKCFYLQTNAARIRPDSLQAIRQQSSCRFKPYGWKRELQR